MSNRQPTPPDFTPALLNELYRLYNKAAGIADQQQFLENELKKRGLSQHQRFVEETFAIVLGAAYVFLDTYPGGAVSSDALWAEHDVEIRRHSPWLDEDNFAWVRYWSQYFAWHDGLVRES
jgi:hypothetical protein